MLEKTVERWTTVDIPLSEKDPRRKTETLKLLQNGNKFVSKVLWTKDMKGVLAKNVLTVAFRYPEETVVIVRGNPGRHKEVDWGIASIVKFSNVSESELMHGGYKSPKTHAPSMKH
jgi:hypothetical protein